jgi:hypothetical protein
MKNVLIGARFGSWTVLDEIAEVRVQPSGVTQYVARCECECGNVCLVARGNLRSGKSTRCRSCRGRESGGHNRRTPLWAVGHKLYSQYQKSAVRRGLEMGLTYEEFSKLIVLPCHYCGAEGMTTTKKSIHSLQHNGVDRVDNAAGYTVSNCVPCCKACNIAKHRMALETFLAHVAKITAFQASSGRPSGNP